VRALAEFTYLRAGPILIGAAVALLVAAPFAVGVFDQVEPFDISDPDSEVQRAYEAFGAATGRAPEAEVVLLVEPAAGRGAAEARRAAGDAADRLAALRGIAAVRTPASTRGGLISDDGRAALVLGFLEQGNGRVETGRRVAAEFSSDPSVTAGGTAVAAYEIGEQSEDDTRKIELYAAPILLLLCMWVFRSALAALLPVLLAGLSIALTFALLNGLSRVIDVDLFSLQVVTGLGVGLAIDYSLFVLARYRTQLRTGDGTRTAQRITLATSGRTVTFSALTVAAALAALILFPNQFLSSTGVAGAIVALISGAAALLVLPAALAMLGPRVDPGFESAGDPASTPPEPLSGGRSYWTSLAQQVMAHPIPLATLALLVMLVIASPAPGGRLTTPDARVLPEKESAKQVLNAIDTRFRRLPPTTIPVVAPPGSKPEEVEAASAAIEDAVPLTTVSPDRKLPDGSVGLLVTAPLDPLGDGGQELIETVRAAPWPAGTLAGGRAAELHDQRASISETAPLVIAVVVASNLVLIMLLVRSLVLPFVAILLNALTVLAAYGVMVAVFENDGPAELLGTLGQDGIDISVPLLAFAVVFGLSTDYGIFLFSRIAEARQEGLDDEDAVIEGISRTGRLITAAAVIFSVAVGAFVFSDLVIVKEFAVAVAVAVLLDATIVRGLLVPAMLKLLGPRAWWWPRAGTADRLALGGSERSTRG
jgi:uncharacterized membrane protein YdfJ with MMPL/SSD domain